MQASVSASSSVLWCHGENPAGNLQAHRRTGGAASSDKGCCAARLNCSRRSRQEDVPGRQALGDVDGCLPLAGSQRMP